MAIERKWLSVAPIPLTANGTQFGVVTVANTAGFKVKGQAVLSANPNLVLAVQIQRVNSPTQMVVGPIGSTPSPANFINISAFTTAANAVIAFSEQDKNRIKSDDIDQAVYEADPTVAIRSVLVDQYGSMFDSTVDAHGVTRLAVDSEVTVNTVQLFTLPFDSISATYPTAVQEVYTSYLGGLGGTQQQVVTVNYVDSSKSQITTVLRTPTG